MAERRKKTKTGNKGKGASGKKPRSRKVRAEPTVSDAASAPAERRPEEGTGPQSQNSAIGSPSPNAKDRVWEPEQTPRDTRKSQNPASGGPRAPLPGELYQRQDQWWWRVQLPGEDKATARPLKADGEETAADGREAAEKITLAMWEHAVEDNATRRIKLESTEKIERLKAQFLDKVRHFTELVETTNANLEAEQRARAEAEAKLAQMVQAVGPMTQNAGHTGPGEGQPAMQSPAPARAGTGGEPAGPELPAPVPNPPTAPTPIPVVEQVSGPCEHPQVHAGQIGRTEPIVTPIVEPPPASVETGRCECCGATGIAMSHLTRIDSGQWLCPHCLAALRTDATRSA